MPKREKGRVGLTAALMITGLATLDQITKQIAISTLISGPIDLGFVRFRLVANRGTLLGIQAPTVVIVAATFAVLIVALQAIRRADLSASIAYGMIAGGALGNVADRLVERSMFPPRAVVDWISLGRWTFNLADVAVVVGVLIAVGGPGFTGRSRDRGVEPPAPDGP